MEIEFSELNVQLCVEWLKDIQLIHHARPTAAIRAGRTGESDVGEAPGHQQPLNELHHSFCVSYPSTIP